MNVRYGPGKGTDPNVREERKAYIREELSKGRTIGQIAAHFNVAKSTIHDWLTENRVSRKYMTDRKERKCLKCLSIFLSSGPGNRRCQKCNMHPPQENPYEI